MNNTYDYIVVGSGSGGGPVASRLAQAGHSVLLIEAGSKPTGTEYDVPAMHGWASQAKDTRWDFLVDHYPDLNQGLRDSKYQSNPPENKDSKLVSQGVLYPRAAAVGGCTVHHALISIYPHDRDWNRIAKMTGDQSWNAKAMRKIYNSFVDRSTTTEQTAVANPNQKWLPIEIPEPRLIAEDPQLLAIIIAAAFEFVKNVSSNETDNSKKEKLTKLLPSLTTLLTQSKKKEVSKNDLNLIKFALVVLDPNHELGVASGREGAFFVPLSTKDAKRVSTREFIERIQSQDPKKLIVESSSFVTQLILEPNTTDDDKKLTAKGVEYLTGDHLYSVGPHFDPYHIGQAELKTAFARKEVILSAGTFNTPQILMLSGIGPKDELAKIGVETKLDLPGVGQNLHDRYEVTVVNRLKSSFDLWENASLNPNKTDDRWLEAWAKKRNGFYTTSGATLAFTKKSSADLEEPDLFVFGMPGYFRGYYPDYHRDILTDGSGVRSVNIFTWAILKKSPSKSNRRGKISLVSKSPFAQPKITFNYFPDGAKDTDAIALANGVRFVRELSSGSSKVRDLIKSELLPGVDKQSDDQLSQWVRDEAWGHHACGTCRMGSKHDDKTNERSPSVVDSKFQVHGVANLRIVDASVFPDIPGFFISVPIYMIAEKAALEILKS